jgi:hypothetical protein
MERGANGDTLSMAQNMGALTDDASKFFISFMQGRLGNDLAKPISGAMQAVLEQSLAGPLDGIFSSKDANAILSAIRVTDKNLSESSAKVLGTFKSGDKVAADKFEKLIASVQDPKTTSEQLGKLTDDMAAQLEISEESAQDIVDGAKEDKNYGKKLTELVKLTAEGKISSSDASEQLAKITSQDGTSSKIQGKRFKATQGVGNKQAKAYQHTFEAIRNQTLSIEDMVADAQDDAKWRMTSLGLLDQMSTGITAMAEKAIGDKKTQAKNSALDYVSKNISFYNPDKKKTDPEVLKDLISRKKTAQDSLDAAIGANKILDSLNKNLASDGSITGSAIDAMSSSITNLLEEGTEASKAQLAALDKGFPGISAAVSTASADSLKSYNTQINSIKSLNQEIANIKGSAKGGKLSGGQNDEIKILQGAINAASTQAKKDKEDIVDATKSTLKGTNGKAPYKITQEGIKSAKEKAEQLIKEGKSSLDADKEMIKQMVAAGKVDDTLVSLFTAQVLGGAGGKSAIQNIISTKFPEATKIADITDPSTQKIAIQAGLVDKDGNLIPQKSGMKTPEMVTQPGPVTLHPGEIMLPKSMNTFKSSPIMDSNTSTTNGKTGNGNITITVNANTKDLASVIANEVRGVLYHNSVNNKG